MLELAKKSGNISRVYKDSGYSLDSGYRYKGLFEEEELYSPKTPLRRLTSKAIKMKYDNSFYPTKNIEESKKFYTDILGLSIKFDFSEQGMITFNVGDEEPAIILKDESKFPKTKPTIWLEVEDVQILYKKLLKRGVNFLSEPFKIRTGWAVEFHDPSGNVIGITDYDEK